MRDAKAGEIRWIHSEHEFDTTKAQRKLQQPKKVKKTILNSADYQEEQEKALKEHPMARPSLTAALLRVMQSSSGISNTSVPFRLHLYR